MLKILAGVDLCDLPALSEISTLEIISETGTDMSKWEDEKHFCSWLNVSPNTKITGGKVISSKIQKKKNRAGQTFRMAAVSLSTSKTPLGDYHRKMKSRLGKKGAVVASAHKMSKIVYTMIKNQTPYDESILIENQEKWRTKRIEYYEKQLAKLKNEESILPDYQHVTI